MLSVAIVILAVMCGFLTHWSVQDSHRIDKLEHAVRELNPGLDI